MSNILIAGGAGLIGSNLGRFLLDKGHEVTIFDNLSESIKSNVDPRCHFFELDIAKDKKRKVDLLFNCGQFDYVYSCQAMAAEVASPWLKFQTYHDCFLTLVNLINSCIKYDVKKIIHFSSIAVWAGRNDPPFFEDTPAIPNDDYGIAKLMGEDALKMAKKQFGLDYSVVRAHNFQGSYLNFWGGLRNFIGIAVNRALQDKSIPVFSDGLQTRQFSSVKFLLDPLFTLLNTDLPITNLGADISHKIIDVAKIVEKIAQEDGKKNVHIEHLDKRDEAIHASCNHDLAKNKLGFKDETDIEELCYEVYNYVKNHEPVEVKKRKFEIMKNLPDYWRGNAS